MSIGLSAVIYYILYLVFLWDLAALDVMGGKSKVRSRKKSHTVCPG